MAQLCQACELRHASPPRTPRTALQRAASRVPRSTRHPRTWHPLRLRPCLCRNLDRNLCRPAACFFAGCQHGLWLRRPELGALDASLVVATHFVAQPSARTWNTPHGQPLECPRGAAQIHGREQQRMARRRHCEEHTCATRWLHLLVRHSILPQTPQRRLLLVSDRVLQPLQVLWPLPGSYALHF